MRNPIPEAEREARDDTGAADPHQPPTRVGRDDGFSTHVRALLGSRMLLSSGTFIAFVGVLLALTLWLGDSFANLDSRLLDVHQNVPVLLLGLAFMVGLVAGAFDLSVASMATLATYLTIGLVVTQDWHFAVVVPFVLLIGLLGGLFNALLVVVVKINPLIATLGSGGVLLGLSRVYGGGTQLSPSVESSQLPAWFSGGGSFGSFQTKFPQAISWVVFALVTAWAVTALLRRRPDGWQPARWTAMVAVGVVVVAGVAVWILRGPIAAMPWTVAFLFATATILWILLTYTALGRHLYATGGNPEAAELAGVRTGRMTTAAFAMVGVLSATAGIVLAANQGSASPDVAVGFLLPAVAIAFLSTVLLSNGQFHVWGTVLGGIFIVAVRQGIIIGGAPFTWAEVLNGAVLILAVGLSSGLRRLVR